MKGEFDSPSKLPSEQYRENWERTFELGFGTLPPGAKPISGGLFYPNGCPIIAEGPQRGDL